MEDVQKEYLVQVTIIEARNLVGKSDDGLSNPFIKIKCGYLPPQATEIIYGTLTPVWNQAFSFTGLLLNKVELQKAELSFEVWSKNNFLGNSLIGTYAVGLFTLYRNANHEFYNVWLTLTCPEFPNDAQGYLLVNCFIIGPNDKPPVHSLNDKVNQDVGEEDEEINLDNMNIDQLKEYQEKKQGIIILGKPSIARKTFQLSMYIFKAEHLIEMEKALFGAGKTDSFISCRAVGLVQKTKTVPNNANPLFNQKMLFPCYFPVLNDKIILRIWHQRSRDADNFIADIPEFPEPNDFFNITKLIALGGRMAAKWINLYGIPPSERNEGFVLQFKKKKHPRQGTWYMGRVLLSLSLLPNEKPKYTVMSCNPFYEPEPQAYRLYFDTYECKYLKNFDIKVWVECRIGNFSTGESRKKRPTPNNTCQWIKDEESKRNDISLTPIIEHFPKDLAQVPDIFINLYTGLDTTERIGYIRLKAEDVYKWKPIPRWLHFNPIDMNNDSPGSILCNMQFIIDNENSKRIFKQKGITKNYKLFAHIVSAFEIDPKNANDDIETKITVDINESTVSTKSKIGRFPFWNELLTTMVELDWKLDFAPDVGITLYRTNKKGLLGKKYEEEIGRFTVPIRSIQEEDKKYPHYFNLIRSGEKVGRVLAMFLICPINQKNIDKLPFEIYNSLNQSKNARLKIFILGARNLDFSGEINNFDLKVDLLQEHETVNPLGSGTDKNEKKKQTEIEEIFSKINSEDKIANKYINYARTFEFYTKIHGNNDFQIFPYLKIILKKKSFFGDDERFLLFNLSEFLSNFNEYNQKIYRVIFEQNLDEIKLDQEQYFLDEFEFRADKNKIDGEEEDEIEEKKDETPTGEEKKAAPPKKKEEEMDEEDLAYAEAMLKQVEFIFKYKNMEISDDILLTCSHQDKENERSVRKKLRLRFKKQRKILRAKDKPTPEETQTLLDLDTKVKDLSKPLMNEDLFFGFDDLSDEYDYGREIFKEDIYEFHPNMKLPYKTYPMMFIPGIFDTKCEDMGGYFRRGKTTDNYLKLFVRIDFLNEDGTVEELKSKEEIEKEKKNKNKNKKQENEDKDDKLTKMIKELDIFNKYYSDFISNLYLNKKEKRLIPKEDLPIQMHGLKVRVYILRCLNLTAQDDSSSLLVKAAGMSAFSKANSFLEIIIGEDGTTNDSKQLKYVIDRQNFVPNTLSPDFFKFYEMDAELPQDWKLTINVWSKIDGGSDALIGTTIIDLEDRYLGEHRTREMLKLKSMEKYYTEELSKKDDENNNQAIDFNEVKANLNTINKKIDELKELQVPVEYRPLRHPSKKTAQGMIEMFVEILPMSRAKYLKPAKIEPPPPENYELRLVIWETKNVFLEGKKTVDIYIKVSYDPEGWLSKPTVKETDCHMGCSTGRGEFNWRMKFDVRIPCTFPRLYFTVFDFNTVGADEAIGECYISLRRVLKRLLQEGKLTMHKKWIPLTHPKDPGETKGEILISLYLLQKDEADQRPVGEAQDEPNRDPKLDRPKEGRGLLDFLAGTIFDVRNWKFNFDFFGNLKIILAVLSVLMIFVVLFVSPGLLTKM